MTTQGYYYGPTSSKILDVIWSNLQDTIYEDDFCALAIDDGRIKMFVEYLAVDASPNAKAVLHILTDGQHTKGRWSDIGDILTVYIDTRMALEAKERLSKGNTTLTTEEVIKDLE